MTSRYPRSVWTSAAARVFGHYFYNVNTAFDVWYDDWPDASVGTYQHGDGVGWPKMPPDEIPSARKYWRTHSVGQILSRVGGGLAEMATISYRRFWYLKYVVLYVAFALILMATCWRPFHEWKVAGVTLTPAHFHFIVFATIALDLVFTLPTRLLADFTGY